MIKEIDPNFLEKLYIEANKDGLSIYLFKYENNYFTIEWNGIKWGEPRIIKFLEIEEKENKIKPIPIYGHETYGILTINEKINEIINVINTKLMGK